METKILIVCVQRDDGTPLPGASVIPTGLRTREERGSCYSWHGAAAHEATTDGNGRAEVPYPILCGGELTTGTVIVKVRHAEACAAHMELDIDAPRPVVLARGTRVRLCAAGPLAGSLRLHADVASDDRQAGELNWERDPNGAALVAFLPDGKYLGRLISRGEDGVILFSSAAFFSVAARDQPDGLEFTWPLQAGTSLRGEIDPGVPRPIRDGWVVAHVTSPQRVENACGVLALGWDSSVDIAPDGSFAVENLPAGTREIIAGCEGYVSENVVKMPLVTLCQARVLLDDQTGPVALAMERTGSARIVVEDPDGRPLSGIEVFSCPNQSLGRGTSILGTRLDTAAALKARDEGTLEPWHRQIMKPRFAATSEAEGMAVIQGLPAGVQTFHVSSERFDVPIAHVEGPRRRGEYHLPRRELRLVIASGAETSAHVRLEHKGTTSLSKAVRAAWNRDPLGG